MRPIKRVINSRSFCCHFDFDAWALRERASANEKKKKNSFEFEWRRCDFIRIVYFDGTTLFNGFLTVALRGQTDFCAFAWYTTLVLHLYNEYGENGVSNELRGLLWLPYTGASFEFLSHVEKWQVSVDGWIVDRLPLWIFTIHLFLILIFRLLDRIQLTASHHTDCENTMPTTDFYVNHMRLDEWMYWEWFLSKKHRKDILDESGL